MKLQILMTLLMGLLCVGTATAAPPAMAPLSAELMSKQPVNLMPADPAKAMTFRNDAESTPPATAVWTTDIGGIPVLRVETFNRPKNIDHVDVKYMIEKPIKRGDIIFVRFMARAEYAKQESGEAIFQISVHQTTPEWARHLLIPLTAGQDWSMIELSFAATANADPTQGEIHLSFGSIPQAVEIASIEVLNFENRVKVSDLPQTRFTYAGREEGAAWRKAALERIETLRTAPINIRVIDAAGRPIPDASVEVRLVRPAFLWGTSVDSALIIAETPEAQKYRDMVLELFDTVVIENGMKWPKWSGTAVSRGQQLQASAWLESQNLRMRGHCLVWPGDKFSPRRIQAMPAPRTELPLLIKEHIRDILTQMRGRVVGWDVVNEMMHERDYFKYMPETEAAEWFKVARETDPTTKLFINDYGMLNGRGSPAKIATYLETVKRLRDAGAPIDVMGIQGHVGRQVRTPVDVLSDLDLLATAGLELQITEFDVNTPDEQLQADYERDFLIALYSHKSVTGFTKWGFWQGRHWKPDAAMFRSDWSEKPSAKVWRELVRGKWLTSVDGKTSTDGTFSTRGHLGDYEFRITAGDKPARQMRALTLAGSASGEPIVIQIP